MNDLAKLKRKYERWQAEAGLPIGINYRVKVETISKGVETSCLDEGDSDSLTLDGHHHFAGVIVSYGREI